ncbi:hypothetical protein [Escherichia phage UPEC06]|nr:hypothetical protein [Escherichia phage UPEC06]
MALVTKYFIEGQQAAQQGYSRVTRYKKEENKVEFFKGYDSVNRDAMVLRFESDPVGKPVTSYQASPQIVYVGTVKECNDKLITLKQSDRAGYFVVYTADGKPYQYESKYFK